MRLRFNRKQIDKLSDIVSDIGLVSLAAVAIPSLLDRVDLIRVILGIVISFTLWIVSVKLRG